MATVAVHPGMATSNAANWVFPACNLGAGQVRGMDRSGIVQGIEEQATKSENLILSSLVLGKNRVVLATCSTKGLNEI